ncbi:MAG: hypothetical protein JSW73_02570 [Candidatus Woesearchaeota archaeon]|nr:MAG: hypothetical protein JSW73_02570 [Candidatus Woesearchaeota archaeon]
MISLLIVGIILWLVIAIRTFIFKKRLVLCIERLIAGDYASGIKIRSKFEDEITKLAKLINRLVDQLRAYDSLRSQSVSLNCRSLETVFTTVKEGIIIADIEKNILKFNLAAQTIFDVEIQTMSFDALEHQPENKQFFELLKDTIERTKFYKKREVIIKLPIRNSTRRLITRLIPLKDDSENVKLIIIFLNKISDIPSSEANQLEIPQ